MGHKKKKGKKERKDKRKDKRWRVVLRPSGVESDEKLLFEPKADPYMERWSCFLSYPLSCFPPEVLQETTSGFGQTERERGSNETLEDSLQDLVHVPVMVFRHRKLLNLKLPDEFWVLTLFGGESYDEWEAAAVLCEVFLLELSTTEGCTTSIIKPRRTSAVTTANRTPPAVSMVTVALDCYCSNSTTGSSEERRQMTTDVRLPGNELREHPELLLSYSSGSTCHYSV
ncbi:hypothetical protein F2P81_016737 [Scophthalmus maximus]|uniref:Uncharacterized protein n=1 Tax=Scophthalmus maximus TaxID=52904 RepID=A0A6A4S466_SCOMX|nr:hypothetical protein F2P81_016737 [Scophthalmus maximus]